MGYWAKVAIDWAKFGDWVKGAPTKRSPHFIYARAVGWSGADKSFVDRWSHAGALGLDRGAYAKFDFCLSSKAQLARLKMVAPPDPAMLPVALEVVTPQPETNLAQTKCWRKMGAAAAKDAVLHLAEDIEHVYGKTPLLKGNRYNLGVLTDARAERYMLWLHAYGRQEGAMNLGGRNPWTLWQYSWMVDAPGIGPHVTADVFFGGLDAYAAFKRGAGNVGLMAAQ